MPMETKTGLKFLALPPAAQSLAVSAIALAAASALATGVHYAFATESLSFDLASTAGITLAVALPVSHFFFRQHARLVRLAADMRVASRTDPLTCLLNRAAFFSDVEAADASGPASAALLFIDADRFKQINDHHGHAVGDDMLTGLGSAITRSVRQGDVAGRLGGEEFAVFLPRADERAAITVADRILRRARMVPAETGHHHVPFTVSVGVACGEHGESVDRLLRTADRRLYEAKEAGRDRISWKLGSVFPEEAKGSDDVLMTA